MSSDEIYFGFEPLLGRTYFMSILCYCAYMAGKVWVQAAELVKKGDHSWRMAAIRFYLLSCRQFSAHPKSSRACIDKRTARAARNTHYRYSKNGPLDHKMADDCVSLARTNSLSSTITKPIKTWKTSNKSYSYNLLNRINKCTHMTYFIYNKSGKRGLCLSINRFVQLNHN